MRIHQANTLHSNERKSFVARATRIDESKLMISDVGDRPSAPCKYSALREEEGQVVHRSNNWIVDDLGDRPVANVKYSPYLEEEGVPHAELKGRFEKRTQN